MSVPGPFELMISIRDAHSPEDRAWIRRAYRDYLEDLAPRHTGIFPALEEYGHREPEFLTGWFTDERSYPLLILKATRPVGFALVVREPLPGGSPITPRVQYRLSEFFVERAHRRLGVGRQAAQLIFSRFAGPWVVSSYQRNTGAVTFWRAAIGQYTGGRYQERAGDGQIHQRFDSIVRPSLA